MKVAAITTRRVSQILHGHRAYGSRSNVIYDTLFSFFVFFFSNTLSVLEKKLEKKTTVSTVTEVSFDYDAILQCSKILSCVTNLFSMSKCLHICYVASTVILSIARPMVGAAFLSPDKPGEYSPRRRLDNSHHYSGGSLAIRLIAASYTYISNYIYNKEHNWYIYVQWWKIVDNVKLLQLCSHFGKENRTAICFVLSRSVRFLLIRLS